MTSAGATPVRSGATNGAKPPIRAIGVVAQITWLHRNGARPGSTDLLIDAARTVHWPNHSDVFAWIACEARAVQAIREHLREAQNLAREQHLAVAYWNALKYEGSQRRSSLR
jgi:NADPH-dependent ferric siderophore reductase